MKKIKVIRFLAKWYKKYGRAFYWRNKISFYKLLACEIFLWKTQADSVETFIRDFFKEYPSPRYIEKTPRKAIAKDIKKLGLSNRRAKLLKRALSNFNPKNIPISELEFRKRFGVGQYISRSVLSIYFNKNLFPVDENIYRFFKRVFNYEIENIRKISKKDERFLKYFIEKGGKSIIWAVIDFASLVCKNKNPKCSKYILRRNCHYCLKNLS